MRDFAVTRLSYDYVAVKFAETSSIKQTNQSSHVSTLCPKHVVPSAMQGQASLSFSCAFVVRHAAPWRTSSRHAQSLRKARRNKWTAHQGRTAQCFCLLCLLCSIKHFDLITSQVVSIPPISGIHTTHTCACNDILVPPHCMIQRYVGIAMLCVFLWGLHDKPLWLYLLCHLATYFFVAIPTIFIHEACESQLKMPQNWHILKLPKCSCHTYSILLYQCYDLESLERKDIDHMAWT